MSDNPYDRMDEIVEQSSPTLWALLSASEQVVTDMIGVVQCLGGFVAVTVVSRDDAQEQFATVRPIMQALDEPNELPWLRVVVIDEHGRAGSTRITYTKRPDGTVN